MRIQNHFEKNLFLGVKIFSFLGFLIAFQNCSNFDFNTNNTNTSPGQNSDNISSSFFTKLTLVAGERGGVGSIDGIGAAARFNTPCGLAFDDSGNLYAADTENSNIRKISADGVVTTIAGSNLNPGSADGIGSAALFRSPCGIAFDRNLRVFYIADSGNHNIRKMTLTGEVTTLAGQAGVAGSNDGAGVTAHFKNPMGVAVESTTGSIYVSDSDNYTVRKITADGIVSTFAGTAGINGSSDGVGSEARFGRPLGIAIDNNGVIYVMDTNNFPLRKISANGRVVTVIGVSGLNSSSIAFDSTGAIYIPDQANLNVYKVNLIDGAFQISILAGSQISGAKDGSGATAQFSKLRGVAVDSQNQVFVSDQTTLRKINQDGTTSTFAGRAAMGGIVDGQGENARFSLSYYSVADSSGNLYVASFADHVIRKVTPQGQVSNFVGQPGVAGSRDGIGLSAQFNCPTGIAIDPTGNIFVVDNANYTIRKITPSGEVTTFAGSKGVKGNVDGQGLSAQFDSPWGLAIDTKGNLYVSDIAKNVIRKVTPSGMVSTYAGQLGIAGSKDGTLTEAQFMAPSGLTADTYGNIFVADLINHTIRKISPEGLVSTLAGKPGIAGHQNGMGSEATFTFPAMLATDAAGNLFEADDRFCVIRKITPAGEVSNFLGQANVCGIGIAGPTDSTVGFVTGLASWGNGIYFFSAYRALLFNPE